MNYDHGAGDQPAEVRRRRPGVERDLAAKAGPGKVAGNKEGVGAVPEEEGDGQQGLRPGEGGESKGPEKDGGPPLAGDIIAEGADEERKAGVSNIIESGGNEIYYLPYFIHSKAWEVIARKLTGSLELDLLRRDDRWSYTREKLLEVWPEAGLLVRGSSFMDLEGYDCRDPYCSKENPAVRSMVN